MTFVDSDYEFRCDLCDKLLSDIETAAQHATTDKHQRQVQYIQESKAVEEVYASSTDGYDMFIQNVIERGGGTSSCGRCPLCSVTLADAYQATQHINSKKHKSNLDWYQRVHAAKAFGKFLSARGQLSQSRMNNESGSYDRIIPHSQFLISEEVGRFIQKLQQGIVVREWEYFCMYCDTKFLSEDAVCNHIHRDGRGNRDSRRRV